MENESHVPFLRELVVFLAAAAIVVPAFQRLKLSPVLGFLIAGVAIGPYGLGLFADQLGLLRYAVIWDVEGVKRLAELGVVFLLFMVGLELTPQRLWSMRFLVFGLGTAQVIVTAAVIGAIAWWWGNSAQAAVLIGACLALSSTAIVMQLLIERGELTSRVGRTAFAILLLQDLAVVPILFLAGLFRAGSELGIGLSLLQALGTAAMALLVIIGIGRLLVRPLFRLAGAYGSPELFMAMTLLAIIGTAAATGAAGLSMATGAFLAGLLLAESEFRHQVKVDIEPFKGLLMGLFFMSIGMGIDLRAVIDNADGIGAGVAGLIALKASLAAGLCLLLGQPLAVAVPVGILLAQGGEFAFVVLGTFTAEEVIPRATTQFMIVVASLTMFLTPMLAAGAAWIRRWLTARQAQEAHAPQEIFPDVEGHVIIAGFGRVGQVVARLLDAQGLAYAGLDLDGERVAQRRERGLPVFYGDAGRAEVLHQMGAARAAALVVTLDDPKAAAMAVTAAKRAWSHLPIYVRARDRDHAAALLAAGATRVMPEISESSLQLAGFVLADLGVPAGAVNRLIEEARSRGEEAAPASTAANRD